MRVLGIDPGYERLGLAVVEHIDNRDTLVHGSCFRTSAHMPFTERLRALGDETTRLIREHRPDHLAIENLFFNTNQKTAMRVSEVRGALLYIATVHALDIFEYTPPQIKAAIAGSGRAHKRDVTTMLAHLIALPAKKRLDDEYDAIAVALTHLACHRGAARTRGA